MPFPLIAIAVAAILPQVVETVSEGLSNDKGDSDDGKEAVRDLLTPDANSAELLGSLIQGSSNNPK